jgi:hypothetical protein
MFECLAKYVLAQSEEKIGEISLEDMALCTAWYNSYDKHPEMTEDYAGFPDMLDHWISNVTQPTTETEGFRQQPLLRALLRKIDISGIDKLSPDAIEFLFFSTGLMQRTPHKHLFERPIKCITPHNESLSKRRNQCRGEPGLPCLEEHITILGKDELMTAKPRDIRTLAGIPLTYRGPVSAHKGEVKILGDLPEQCCVVVEDGSCYIRGSILGNIATTHYCEVFENISGTAIARKGSVRAAKILNQATVISKEKDVYCVAVQNSKTVFAGAQLKVKNDAIGSTLYGRQINIDGDSTGNIIHSSFNATAQHFRKTDQRAASVVLRRALNCDDYGETLSPEAAKLLTQARNLHNQQLDLQAP